MKPIDIKQEVSGWLIEDRDPAVVKQLRMLTTVMSVIFLVILFVAISLFYIESRNRTEDLIYQRLTHAQQDASDHYRQAVKYDTNALHAIIDTLKRDKKLEELFATYNRDALFEYIQPLYRELNRHYNVTHFYFNRPDRVNLLRVHAPSRYGDKIDRFTAMAAEQHSMVANGVELGVLGTFTLRVVAPWHDTKTGNLIGYVELGMELDHIIRQLSTLFGHDSVILIYKEFLDRKEWERGMRELGRPEDWDQLEKFVLGPNVTLHFPTSLLKHFEELFSVHPHKVLPLNHEGTPYWPIIVSLHDVEGREVAELLMLSDVSEETDALNTTMIVVGVVVFVLGLLLVLFFSWQMRLASRRIEQDEDILKQLAVHDALTKLYTRRVFHQYLDAEIERSSRFNHPLSLLMVDLDHFKKVNDRYGHQAGDRVLKEVSERLMKSVRSVDYIFRYGGEEIAIILPESDTDTALHFAQRIGNMISAFPVDIADDQVVSITVSIGIATFPEHADSDILLIAAADDAMYAAKNAGRNRICIYPDKCEQ